MYNDLLYKELVFLLRTVLFLLGIPLALSLSYGKVKQIPKLISFSCFHIYFSNSILSLCSIVFLHKYVLHPSSLDLWILQCVGNLILVLISAKIYQAVMQRKFVLYRKTTCFFAVLFSALFIFFSWLYVDSGRMSFELFFYNLTAPINTSATGFYTETISLAFYVLLMCFCCGMLCFHLFQPLNFHHRKQYSLLQRSVCVVLPIGLCLVSLYSPVYMFHLEDAYRYLYEKSSFIEEHYVNPDDVTIHWPEKKRNVLLIFMESFESSYFSKELGGLSDVNLLPQLSTMMEKGVSFSNHESAYGGAISVPYATVTVAGMATTLSGVNYKVPSGYENDATAVTIPYIVTLNDLLERQGYRQDFRIGTYVDDYNIGRFYRAHGNAQTIGYEERLASGQLPEGYKVWWGFEDKKLYEFAKEDLTRLSNEEEPFFYVMSTNDTHRVGGYTDESCSTNYSYAMQNSIACADRLSYDFLSWVMEQPFYENTTVVVLGDHIGHEEEYTKTLPTKDRRVFNLFLNSQQKETNFQQKQRDFWSGDFFPTIVAAMGAEIEGNRLGLGVNLFSEEPSLMERYPREFVETALSQQSDFYSNTFVFNK